MKRQRSARRLVFFLSAFFIGGASTATTVPPVKHPKKPISIVRTECLVVATEAKRIVPSFSSPDPYARELWERVSEDVNPCHLVCLFTLLNITPGRDVLGYDSSHRGNTAPSGAGWISDYLDSFGEPNQRHHFGFHFFIGASGGWDALVSSTAGLINDFDDSQTNNAGDLRLSGAAQTLGTISLGSGQLPLVSKRVKGGFCVHP